MSKEAVLEYLRQDAWFWRTMSSQEQFPQASRESFLERAKNIEWAIKFIEAKT